VSYKLIRRVFIAGMVIAVLSYLFHPEVGQFSLMMNGAPVAEPLIHLAAIPTFLVIILITGILMLLLFFGIGAFLFMTALIVALIIITIAVPFFWPILLIIFVISLIM